MRKIEIIERDRKGVKLTIAKDRVTIKFPIGFENKEETTQKLLDIANGVTNTQYTLRGCIKDNFISLKTSSNVFFKRYEL